MVLQAEQLRLEKGTVFSGQIDNSFHEENKWYTTSKFKVNVRYEIQKYGKAQEKNHQQEYYSTICVGRTTKL